MSFLNQIELKAILSSTGNLCRSTRIFAGVFSFPVNGNLAIELQACSSMFSTFSWGEDIQSLISLMMVGLLFIRNGLESLYVPWSLGENHRD